MDTNNIIYSKNVIEFVTVASEYCALIEKINTDDKAHFLSKIHKILPLLYLKTITLPKIEKITEGETEKFVREEIYIFYRDLLSTKLDADDIFMDIYEPQRQEGEDSISIMLSEGLMDIYQDLKDFISNFQLGVTQSMNDALWDCNYHFETYWGPRLMACTNMLHNIKYKNEEDE